MVNSIVFLVFVCCTIIDLLAMMRLFGLVSLLLVCCLAYLGFAYVTNWFCLHLPFVISWLVIYLLFVLAVLLVCSF